jgi:hypothetical protein
MIAVGYLRHYNYHIAVYMCKLIKNTESQHATTNTGAFNYHVIIEKGRLLNTTNVVLRSKLICMTFAILNR